MILLNESSEFLSCAVSTRKWEGMKSNQHVFGIERFPSNRTLINNKHLSTNVAIKSIGEPVPTQREPFVRE